MTDGEAAALLEAPPREAALVAAEHLQRAHGVSGFMVGEHVYLGGPRRDGQLLLWNPALASFACQVCGRVISTGVITEERLFRARLHAPGLRPFLVFARTPYEREAVTRAFLRGELGEELLRPVLKRARRKPAAARPSVEHRYRRVQAWMLERYSMLGVKQRVIEEALRLQLEDRDAWALIAARPLSESTLNRYWRTIPDGRVAAAKALYQARRAKKMI